MMEVQQTSTWLLFVAACALVSLCTYYFTSCDSPTLLVPPVLDQDSPMMSHLSSVDPTFALAGCLKNGSGNNCWNAFRRKQFLDTLDILYASPPEQLEHFQMHNWQLFDLITPTHECDANGLRRVGAEGDGGKWVCGPVGREEHKCVIFSLGCNNQFDFEEAIDKFTQGKCEIHTFDCTGEWSNPHTSFHRWCIGDFDGQDEQGRTFKLLSTAAKELGVESVSLLKMDIEHSEYGVFESLKRVPESFLPDQMLVELHVAKNYPPFQNNPKHWVLAFIDVIRDIDRLGYSFALQERNTLCGGCSEFVLIRRPNLQ